tara:strand:- start:20 stop:196 length:177 start_codon:yes stop_codon:yes gene_type:complete
MDRVVIAIRMGNVKIGYESHRGGRKKGVRRETKIKHSPLEDCKDQMTCPTSRQIYRDR